MGLCEKELDDDGKIDVFVVVILRSGTNPIPFVETTTKKASAALG